MTPDLGKIAIIASPRRVTFREMFAHTRTYASLLPRGEEQRIVLFSENREEWVYAFFSIWQRGGIAIPVDAGSTAHDVAYILSDATPHAIWVSKATAPVALEAIREAGLELKPLYLDEVLPLAAEGAAAAQGPGAADPSPQSGAPSQEDEQEALPWAGLDVENNPRTALIIYTSGTTGSPKGVMLSYANLRANIQSVSVDCPIFNPQRRTLVLLPLHHVLPLMGSLIAPMYVTGGVAICPSLSGPDLLRTLVESKAAIVIGVPRLYQTLFSGIKKKIDSSALTRLLYQLCYKAHSRRLSRLVFGSIRRKMGGAITFFVSGGAALDREIGEGMRTLGLDVLEGYGMTETAPIIAFTRPGDIRPGCAGLPLPGVECKLVDGELLARGANVMKGYYNRPEETAAVIDADGFIHTGDLATIGPEGHVTITGRCKEIIVLSNGKNVQPNEIEFKLEQYDQYVREAAVVQDGDLLRAIIVPQSEWAANLSDGEAELALKREVLEPYNRTVANYKKLMSLMVYRGELPRTRMEKLQRYKLRPILEGRAEAAPISEADEPQLPEYQILKAYIEAEKHVRVSPTSHVETDLAMDSLDKVGLQGFMEHTFGVQIRVEQMADYPSILAMAEYLAKAKTHSDVEEMDWHRLLHEETHHLDLAPLSPLFHLASGALRTFLRLWNRLSIKGLEHLPEKGPYILAPNHQSFIDAPVALSGLSREALSHCYSYATEEHVGTPARRWMARRANVIIMERAYLKRSILCLAEVLRQGRSIIIFPEGRRTHDGDVDTFKKTFAILAKELEVPIVPVAINGAFEAWPRHARFIKPRHIGVEYLPPIVPQKGESYEQLAERVRQAIVERVGKG